MPEIAAAFKARTGREVKLAFGASGNFSRQIREGAPFELFLSADEANVRLLVEAGAHGRRRRRVRRGPAVALRARGIAGPGRSGARRSRRGAEGRHGAPRRDREPRARARTGRRRARRCRRKGCGTRCTGRIVLGENVNQTAQFALTGGVGGRLHPLFDRGRARTSAIAGRSVLVPESLHEPIRQRMVLVKGAGETARGLYDFVRGPEAARSSSATASTSRDERHGLDGVHALAQARRRDRAPAAAARGRRSGTRSRGGGSAGRARSRRSSRCRSSCRPRCSATTCSSTFAPTSRARAALPAARRARRSRSASRACSSRRCIANLPFAVQPVQRGFEAIAPRGARGRVALRHVAAPGVVEDRAAAARGRDS